VCRNQSADARIADCNKLGEPSFHSFSGDKPGCFGTIFVSNRMECEEKARLIEEHSRVALAYSRAARALRGKKGTRSAEDQQALDEARI